MSRCLVNGYPLAGSRQYEFGLSSGSAPMQRQFEVTLNVLAELERADSITLTIGDRTFERLALLDIGPGRTPSHRTVTLSDVRWRWPDKPLAHSFNIRRVTGDTFLLGDGRVEVAPVDAELQYAKYSLYPVESPSEPWTAYQVLEWCLTQMPGVSGVRTVGDVRNLGVEVNDLTLFDPGHRGLDRVLQSLPGLGFYLDYDGQTVVIYDTRDDTAELALVDTLDARTHTRPRTTVKVVDRSRRMPAYVDCLFLPEIEHRFDYNDAGTRVTDSNTMTMVAQTVDPETSIAGRTVGRSTWAELVQLLESPTWTHPVAPQLTMTKLREQYGGQWRYLEPLYTQSTGAFDAKWASRWRAIRQSFRRLFQVDAVYRQRLAAVKPTRVAILNYQTGTRGPAEAYCDWIRRPSFLGLGPYSGTDPDHGWSVSGYATDLDDAEPAPVAVSVADPGAMVFRLDGVVDPYGIADAIMLGAPSEGQIPKQAIGAGNRGVAVLSRWDYLQVEELELSLLVTVVPGSPNTLDRFHRERIPGPPGARGPGVEVLVFPGLITAQFGWRDERGQQILDYVRGLGGQLDPSWLVNQKHVRDVAEATAKGVFDRLADTPGGNAEIDLDGSLTPTGQLAQVIHRLDNGRTVSLLQWPGARQAIDAWRFLNGATRRALLGDLQQGGTGQ